jgi:hypothetical protein
LDDVTRLDFFESAGFGFDAVGLFFNYKCEPPPRVVALVGMIPAHSPGARCMEGMRSQHSALSIPDLLAILFLAIGYHLLAQGRFHLARWNRGTI